MITTVNQVSSAWFDNKLVRKSLHNETNDQGLDFANTRLVVTRVVQRLIWAIQTLRQ